MTAGSEAGRPNAETAGPSGSEAIQERERPARSAAAQPGADRRARSSILRELLATWDDSELAALGILAAVRDPPPIAAAPPPVPELAAQLSALQREPQPAERITFAPVHRDPRDVARISELETALGSLVARVRAAGGYASPAEQNALWQAERALAGGAEAGAVVAPRAVLPELAAHIAACPIGWHNGRTLIRRATTDADVVFWLQRLFELGRALASGARGDAAAVAADRSSR